MAQRTSGTVSTTKVTAKGSGQNWLPKAYRRVEIKQSQFKLKYEEFDFSYYNKTRFAGLENDIVNSYCNALLQVRLACNHHVHLPNATCYLST
jgi:PAB-dependent poly(A)-specific ribonuclease subunit 2